MCCEIGLRYNSDGSVAHGVWMEKQKKSDTALQLDRANVEALQLLIFSVSQWDHQKDCDSHSWQLSIAEVLFLVGSA